MDPLPARMRAVLLTGHGGYERLEYREDVPVPRPGAGEVLLRVGAAGINNTDINVRTAWYSQSVRNADSAGAAATGWTGSAAQFPRIQGADACGRIVAVGPGVPAARLGERVLIEPLLRERAGLRLARPDYFGSECDGGFADYTVVPAANAHRIDSRLSDVELASFPCAYGAAENMVERAGVQAGETVLVTGASGGVGSAAIQLARRRGAQVIALAQPAKAELLQELGAARVIARDAELARELGAETVDVVIDVAGGPQFPALLQLLRCGGRYATAGALAGPLVELDLRVLYLKDLRLFGCTDYDSALFPALIGHIERGEIRPLVAAVFPLREIVRAQQLFLERRHVGKIVLTLDPA